MKTAKENFTFFNVRETLINFGGGGVRKYHMEITFGVSACYTVCYAKNVYFPVVAALQEVANDSARSSE